MVEAEGWIHNGSYNNVDVDSVDMDKYPNLRDVPWWSAVMEKGDCLFIPMQ